MAAPSRGCHRFRNIILWKLHLSVESASGGGGFLLSVLLPHIAFKVADVHSRIVGQPVANDVGADFRFSVFPEHLKSAAYTRIMHHSIITVLNQQVITGILRGRPVSLLQVGSIAKVILRSLTQNTLIVTLSSKRSNSRQSDGICR